jgi:anti-anti-sigma regulatory factor
MVRQATAEIDRLRASGIARIVLDLRHASFLDSSGLRLVLDVQAAASRDGWDFDVIARPPRI